MNSSKLSKLFEESKQHRLDHQCGGYPYEYGHVLTALVAGTGAKSILEVGTALGYTTACMAYGSTKALVDTIDQDESHLRTAEETFRELEIAERVTTHYGKAEGILRELQKNYDFIFFDAYSPQMKMLIEFERLLKPNGMLVTANLFIRDPQGGKYLRSLQNEKYWKTGVFADTAIAVKLPRA